MSFRTPNMVQTDTPHAMHVSLKQQTELPHILRQSNYLGSADMRTANVNFRVLPHAEAQAAPAPAERVECELRGHELYPT
jgi:hypothetical protein